MQINQFDIEAYFEFLEQFWQLFPQAIQPQKKIIMNNVKI